LLKALVMLSNQPTVEHADGMYYLQAFST